MKSHEPSSTTFNILTSKRYVKSVSGTRVHACTKCNVTQSWFVQLCTLIDATQFVCCHQTRRRHHNRTFSCYVTRRNARLFSTLFGPKAFDQAITRSLETSYVERYAKKRTCDVYGLVGRTFPRAFPKPSESSRALKWRRVAQNVECACAFDR